jgi:hypothetical protein
LFYLRSIILTENKIESEVGNLKAFSPWIPATVK